MEKTVASRISKFSPCTEAVTWLGKQTDVTEAWNTCPRGDWLLWISGRVGIERTILVKSAAACARLALVYVKEGELRPLRAIEAAEAWASDPTEENRKTAAYAVYAAAAAYAADAAYAAAAAVYAADAYAAYAAYAAAVYAVYAAADAADAAAAYAAAARKAMQLKTADAVRALISAETIAALIL